MAYSQQHEVLNIKTICRLRLSLEDKIVQTTQIRAYSGRENKES